MCVNSSHLLLIMKANHVTWPRGENGYREYHCTEVKEAMMMMMILTVDADDFDHSECKERQGFHLHLHQHRCDEKHHENDRQTAWDPPLLRNPGRNEQKKITQDQFSWCTVFWAAIRKIPGNLTTLSSLFITTNTLISHEGCSSFII